MDRKTGESEDEDLPQVTQMFNDKEPAPAPTKSLDLSCSEENERSVDESYTQRLEESEPRGQMSDSRQYTIESEDGGVQEIHANDSSEMQVNF